jgi:polyisoprenoid-binding protein YceI
MRKSKRFFSTVIIVLLLSANALADRVFVVNDPSQRDTVRFVLDAPLEVINGFTNAVTGRLTEKESKLSGQFEVPVASLQTGIEKRDEHLRGEKWMDAKKFPKISFVFKALKLPDSFWKGKPLETQLKGKFTIRGKTREEKVKISLRYLPESEQTKKRLKGNLIKVKGSVSVRLANYGIAQSDSKLKSILGLKVGEQADISVDLMATDKK